MFGDGDAVALPTPSSASAHTVTLHNAVILREVAVSMVECRGRWLLWLMRWLAGDGFRDCARNTNAVILREVAVSMVECRGRWLLWLMRWLAGDGFRDCARNDEVGALGVLREWRGGGQGSWIPRLRAE